jgi:hypothetical protein
VRQPYEDYSAVRKSMYVLLHRRHDTHHLRFDNVVCVVEWCVLVGYRLVANFLVDAATPERTNRGGTGERGSRVW